MCCFNLEKKTAVDSEAVNYQNLKTYLYAKMCFKYLLLQKKEYIFII